MTDHTWISPVGKSATFSYQGHTVRMNVLADSSIEDDPRKAIIVTGRLCALSRFMGNGVGFKVARDIIEGEPTKWPDDE